MINRPRPRAGKSFPRVTAVSMSLRTAGCVSVAADGSRTKRVCRPLPCRIPSGSGSFAPWMKHNPTPLAPAATDSTASDGRSVGP